MSEDSPTYEQRFETSWAKARRRNRILVPIAVAAGTLTICVQDLLHHNYLDAAVTILFGAPIYYLLMRWQFSLITDAALGAEPETNRRVEVARQEGGRGN